MHVFGYYVKYIELEKRTVVVRVREDKQDAFLRPGTYDVSV